MAPSPVLYICLQSAPGAGPAALKDGIAGLEMTPQNGEFAVTEISGAQKQQVLLRAVARAWEQVGRIQVLGADASLTVPRGLFP